MNCKQKKLTKNNKEKVFYSEKEKLKFIKKYSTIFLIWICILAIGLVKKGLQNDTFYTIEIGKLILSNGIDMIDHFSFHTNLPYTYPHWLYDVFIFLIYKIGNITAIYISSIILLMILLIAIFITSKKITKNAIISSFATILCALNISGFATARAQLISFILFILEIYFIESFLEKKKTKYIIGLLLISLAICNIHAAVWSFYFILYLPYPTEYLISSIYNKIKLKKENRIINFIKNKLIFEKNENIKYLFIIMIISTLTGLITPIKDTPYTYLIKIIIGNSQNYILEHQMISWINSPFIIIISIETILLIFLSKTKLRDLFMISGLIFMSITSIRHLSLLVSIGIICFARLFKNFLDTYNIDVNIIFMKLFKNKKIAYSLFIFGIILSGCLFYYQNTKEFIDKTQYPVEAVKYIKENLNINEIRIFNGYDFGSYLIHNNIPVFIDSRADLYTKQFNNLEYDIFDDYIKITSNYKEKFNFYNITHVLLNKKKNILYSTIIEDKDYEIIYEDKYFVLFKKNINYLINNNN